MILSPSPIAPRRMPSVRRLPGFTPTTASGGKGSGAHRTWVIDPIDGTRAFILGQLHWGTLIALNEGGPPVLGVMHQPFVGETFWGSTRDAYLSRNRKDQRLRTRICPLLRDAVV